MRRRILLFLALLVSGCTIPTAPNYPQASVEFNNYFDGLFRPAIPWGHYDGTFMSYMSKFDYFDSTGTDTEVLSYDSQVRFYNIFGDLVHPSLTTLSVQLNGVLLSSFQPYYSFDTSLPLNFPSPVTWSFAGDNYFPSLTHTVSSENPVEILSPESNDSQEANIGFDVAYTAPGVDTVTVTLTYFGKGIFSQDTTGALRDAIQSLSTMAASSGHFSVPPFKLDTSSFKSFTPQFIEAGVAWGHGDTIHVDGKVYGLVTIAGCSRNYYFKQ